VDDAEKPTNEKELELESVESRPATEAAPPPEMKSLPSKPGKKRTPSLQIADQARQPSQPFSSRLQSRLQHGLRRAALEREERGEAIHTIQDILADAVEKWLKMNEPNALKTSRTAISDG